MINMVRKLVTPLKEKTTYLNYGREIIVNWCSEYVGDINRHEIKLLDIGCGRGTDLLNIKGTVKNKRIELFGVEYYEPNARQAKQNGLQVLSINIEKESIPVEDEFFDVVIANQIIEHTREIFWIFSEISRSLKKRRDSYCWHSKLSIST